MSTFIKKSFDEHDFPLFHVLSQSYIENEVFTIPRIPVAEEVKKPTGCLWAMSETPKGQQMLTVWDTGAVVCVAPVSTMTQTKTTWSKGSDINFVMADGVKRAPVGIAERFVFRVKNVYFAVRCYVVELANYQLLLGTEFLVATGAGLFPRWGKIIITLPSRIDIDAHCKRITVEVGALPLLEEDADEYDEKEFDLQVPTVHSAYFMAPDATAIRIGMKDLIGDIDGSIIPDIEIPLKDVQKALQESPVADG